MKKNRRKAVIGREPKHWLEKAARWRLLSLLFQLPTRETRREVTRLAKSAPGELRAAAEEWLAVPLKTAAAEFQRVLGPGGIPGVESSYDPNALAGRGPLLADIAGFHQAFGYRPPKPPAEVPDHIAVELDFLSYLAFKTAFALHAAQREEAEITAQACEQFQKDHLLNWVAAFRERLGHSGSVCFTQEAALIAAPKKKKARGALLPVLASVLFVFSLLANGVRAQAQTSAPAAKQAQPGAAAQTSAGGYQPIKLGEVTFSGNLRARMENWAWFEAPAGDDDYTFGAFNLRLALEQKKERFEWRVEGLFPLLIGLPATAVLPAPQGQLGLGGTYFAANGRQDGSGVLRQAYVRFKGIFGDAASSFRAGRFEFADGMEAMPGDAKLATLKRERIAQRLVGGFGFSHVGRGFDGIEYARSSKQNNLTIVAARPTEGVFQLRSLRELDVDFYYAAYTRQFTRAGRPAEARAFVLHYHDGRGALKTDNRPLAARAADARNIRLTTIGGHTMVVFGAGKHKTDLLVWGAGQFGRWGELDHRAAAFAVEAGHQFPGAWKPWLRGGFFRSTGDGDPADTTHGTFFQVLPTPRIYARFPFFNLMNNQDAFVEFRVKPAAKLAVRSDVRGLWLASDRDLWYVGGGAFQTQTFGYIGRPANGRSGLGTLFDVSVDYDVTSLTRITFYVGGVRGGGVPAAIYPAGGNNPGSRFLYVELFQRF